MASIIVAKERVQRRKLEEEHIRRLENKLYQKQPMEWLKHRFGEDPLNFQWSKREGYENHKWDGDEDPLYNAWQSLADGNWVGVEAATGTSKTFMLSRIVFWFLDCFENCLVVTSAPKQDQLKLHLWSEIATAFPKFKKIRPKARLYGLRLVVEDSESKDVEGDDAFTSKSWQAVGFVAGVGGDETSATKAQGFHREHMLIITEETPGMPMAVMTAFKNTSVGETNMILAVGNPDSQLDPLHQFCVSPTVMNYRVSAYDYPNVVHRKSVIKGAVTVESIRRRIIDNGKKSDLYKSRVRGISPSQSTDSLIKLAWCKAAAESKQEYDGTFHAVGVDVANSMDGDKAALAWGRGQILTDLQEFQCPNATHLAYNLYMDSADLHLKGYLDYDTKKLAEYEIMDGFIGVDGVGVGVATVNSLMESGHRPVSLFGGQWEDAIPEETKWDSKEDREVTIKKWRFQGIRSQMYWEAREDLRKGLIRIDLDDENLLQRLFFELISIKVKFKDNFIAIESKEEIKKRLGGKSPNLADAFVYWNWTRKGYRLEGGFMPLLGGG